MASDKINIIQATEILDSRGNPTIQVRIELDSGLSAKASVPSGASTGVHEALELRDGDKKRYGGKGVLNAIGNVNKKIAPLLVGYDIDDLSGIDQIMIDADATNNKSNFGANAILGVSLAAARVGALANDKPLYEHLRDVFSLSYKDYQLPSPLSNIVNGGEHADNKLDWQEFWIIPQGINEYPEALRACTEVFHNLAKEFKAMGHSTNVGDEGGYAPQICDAKEVWDVVIKSIKAVGYKPGKHIFLGMDAGSSEFYNNDTKKYELKGEGKSVTSSEMLDIYESWLKDYPILALEDPFDQDDWDAWQDMTANKKFKRIAIIGDDLFVTNVKRLQKGIDTKVANAILIKVNQIGSLSETIAAIKLAQENNYEIAISHRSGETTDDFIADLAVAVNSEFIKIGATCRGERIVKYNRLLEIYNEINGK
jgi:enolase 1/2/3